jgi:hypothetical protein
MDQVPLVTEQLADGQRLVEELARQGFSVTSAGWAKTSDDGQWYLYLVSPTVDDAGIRKAYGRVYPVIQQMQKDGLGIDPFEVKLLSPADPLAKALADWHGCSPRKTPTRYGGGRLGDVNIDGAYI